MQIVVVSTSLHSESKSRRLALASVEALKALGVTATLVDLRAQPIPLCDGETIWDDPTVQRLQEQIRGADGIIIAAPIYNWSVAASTKNLVECVGSAFERKVVGILCAAGGPRALLAPASLIQSLIFDYQCIISPKVVVVGEDGFTESGINQESVRRVSELCGITTQLAGALARLP